MKSHRIPPRIEPRRTGNVIIIASMLLSLCILSLIKARYCSAPYAKSHVMRDRDAMEALALETQKSPDDAAAALPAEEEEDEGNGAISQGESSGKDRISGPICSDTSKRSTVCEAAGDIRLLASSRTILLPPSLTNQEWKTKPYQRNHDPPAMKNIKEWTLKPFPAGGDPPPRCTARYNVPALVFSVGGFTGNLFHDFTDVLFPLFISAHRFGGEVQFVIADNKPWWVSKFSLILKQLSNYEIIDAGGDDPEAVRCFPRVVVGLSFHKDMGVDPARTPKGYSAADFKAVLRRAYGLERATAAPTGEAWDIRRKPRLLIISRKGTRAFLNERGMADMAMSLGFDVRVAEPDATTDLAKFARLVNSADVMIGVHGAGLTNMVFLPAGAVLIQVVPMGGLDWLARETFGDAAPEMELKYMAYRIQADESTLSEQYPKDHPVIKDPYSIHKQGWSVLSKIYLDKQNVRPHLGRLRNTLMEALKHLPHGGKLS